MQGRDELRKQAAGAEVAGAADGSAPERVGKLVTEEIGKQRRQTAQAIAFDWQRVQAAARISTHPHGRTHKHARSDAARAGQAGTHREGIAQVVVQLAVGEDGPLHIHGRTLAGDSHLDAAVHGIDAARLERLRLSCDAHDHLRGRHERASDVGHGLGAAQHALGHVAPLGKLGPRVHALQAVSQ